MPIVIFKKIIFLAVVLALIFGFAYTLAQQVLRQSADDPQIQIAQDAAVKLAEGKTPDFFRSNVYGQVDLARGLAPFLIVFDAQGKPLASTGILNGKTPVPPAGVFEYAKKYGADRITWQPAPDVRIAAFLAYYNGSGGGFTLAGRSLREVENRSVSLGLLAFSGWIFAVIVASISLIIF
jgi:hypothetical protein